MSLYGAMFSGVSGLNAESQALGTIADNIANVNTVGYKETSAQFSTLVTNLATANSYTPGGVIFRTDANVDKQGLIQSSGSATDLAISGNGMFVVNEAANPGTQDPFVYTRAGSFEPDQNGDLRNTAGFYLQGWPTDSLGNVLASNLSSLDSLEPVNISGTSGSASATTFVSLGANLPAEATVGTSIDTNFQIFDSLGVGHSIALTWTKSSINEWDLAASAPTGTSQISLADATGASYYAAGALDFSSQPSDGDTITIGSTTYEFDNDASVAGGNTAVTIAGGLLGTLTNFEAAVGDARVTLSGTSTVNIVQSAAGGALTIDPSNTSVVSQSPNGSYTVPAVTASIPALTFSGDGTPSDFNVATIDVTGWPSGALDSSIAFNLGTAGLADGMTQFAGDYNVVFINQDGIRSGAFSGVSISDDGMVVALFDNGDALNIYRLPLVTFPNPNGLFAENGNVFSASDTSGAPILRFAKLGSAGTINAGALENSTVDIGNEFTNMIIAQRAYSASSRVISTADEMLDELMRIKR